MHGLLVYTVKRLIIGDYLFDEIGEFFKFAKISCHQIGTLQSLDITSVGNRQIKSLPNCHIWKTAKYNSRQIFSFYSNYIYVDHVCGLLSCPQLLKESPGRSTSWHQVSRPKKHFPKKSRLHPPPPPTHCHCFNYLHFIYSIQKNCCYF